MGRRRLKATTRTPPTAHSDVLLRDPRLNLRLDVAYDGSSFHGFARQRDVRTVQGEVESALQKIFSREVRTTGAGRTDAGVHALGQVMNTRDAPDEVDPGTVLDSLNGMLGPAMAFTDCREAGDRFDSRFSARSRTYVYAILEGRVPDPFLAWQALHHRELLDVEAMNEAAGHLLGVHDFGSFGRVEEGRSAKRTLYELKVWRARNLVRLRARANAFIHQMVRSLVGTLIQVGEHRRTPDEIVEVLRARDRAAAGPVAPSHGLCLVSVEYDDGWSRPFDPVK